MAPQVGLGLGRSGEDGFRNDGVVLDQQLSAAHLAVEKSCEQGGCEGLPPTMKVSRASKNCVG